MLKTVQERDWLYLGHRATEWCPRCGTSISAHELAGNYVDRADPSLYVRLPLLDRPGESLIVWTTTPWTLPANVAAAVKPDADYGRRAERRVGGGAAVSRRVLRRDPEGLRDGRLALRGPVRRPAARRGRRAPRDRVGRGDDGRGHRHRPHRARLPAPRTSSSAASTTCRCSRPSTSRAASTTTTAGCTACPRSRRPSRSSATSRRSGRLVESGLYEHRYPECWRCHTPLIFRIADDWFISVRDLRQQMLDANSTVQWVPEYMGKRMDDWLHNMGDWNISRRRYYGLPLPFYPCACGHLNVIGSKRELEERAVEGLDQLEELRRPWIDRVPIRCEQCGDAVERIVEVGDVWLDAGIVPFSTLGWQNDTWVPGGYGTGAARGLTGADLPDHAYWEQWFPADWVSEMREQIRLWFYSQLFMSVVLTGGAPFKRVLGYEKMLDENGREMHGSWGNMIDADDAFARMGADVMRWQYCAQPPNQNLLFGFGPAEEIKGKLLQALELGARSSSSTATRRTGVRRGRTSGGPARGARTRSTAGWSSGRGRSSARPTQAYEDTLSFNVVARLRGVCGRPLELVHPPLAAPVLGRRRGRAADALVRAGHRRPGDRAGDAVPGRGSLAAAVRAPVAEAPASVLPRRLARAGRARSGAARRDRGRAPGRRARPPGALDDRAEAAPAASPARRPGPVAARARGRAARRAARQAGRVRAG